MAGAEVIDFATWAHGAARAAVPGDLDFDCVGVRLNAAQMHAALEGIAKRAGHHVRLSSIIRKRTGCTQQQAEVAAIHLSHYVLSGRVLPD